MFVAILTEKLRAQRFAVFLSAPQFARRRCDEGAIQSAPGDYKLFAWESIPNTAYMNAAFMEKHESRGLPVTLAAGSESTFDLTVIPNEGIHH
jgi:hypothetical protein